MTQEKICLPAPAKLNLFLHIIGRREDGYHLLQSAMQFIDLSDTLTFQLRSDAQINLQVLGPDLPIEDNLVYRAAVLLKTVKADVPGVDICLDKRLPMGAGLGGGSSDAATTLLALNKLWALDLSIEDLAAFGLRLGADVPFFVWGVAAWIEGIGEKITPIELPEPWYVLVMSDSHIATERLFKDPALTRNCEPITIDDYVEQACTNVFTDIVCQNYPAVAKALSWLGQFSEARMTGTGSVVFAAFDTEEEAGRIAALSPEDLTCIITKGLNVSSLQECFEG